MTVWGIADLHLDFANPQADSRERFAGRWRDHALAIEANWRATVGRDDLVLLPGDFSMARNHRDLQPDLAWLDRLPGWKVLSPGNHDRWWNHVDKVRAMLRRTLLAVEGDAVRIGGVVVCGAKGAPIPKDDDLENTSKPWKRELAKLETALPAAAGLRAADEPVYVLWHYPPFDQHGRASECSELCARSGASTVVYGHLHNQGQWSAAMQGTVDGVRYRCVAADSIGFRPLRVSPTPG